MNKEHVDIHFADCPAYTCELSWAQQWLFSAFGERMFTEGALNIPLKVLFEGGVSVEAAVRALRMAVCRHDALRTVYPELSAGECAQVVLGSGTFRLGLMETDAQDIPEFVRLLVDNDLNRPLPADDLPFTLVLITQQGKAVALAGWVQHMSADGIAALILVEEIQRLAVDPGAHLPPVWGTGQLVDFERSPTGRRHAAAADEYLRRQLAVTAGRSAHQRHDPLTPRHFALAFNSAAVSTGTRILSARHGVTEESVLLAALTLARVQADRQDVSTVCITSSNRFMRGMRGMVANLFQDSLLSIKVGGVGFADLLRITSLASLSAYKYGHFDPRLAARTLEENRDGPAGAADLGWSVSLRMADVPRLIDGKNSVRQAERTASLARQGAVRALTERTQVWQLDHDHERPPEAMFAVYSLAEMSSISFTADSARYTPDEVTTILRTFEQVIVDAVEDGTP